MLSPLSTSQRYVKKIPPDSGLDNSYISSGVSSLTDNDFSEATSNKTPKTGNKNQTIESEATKFGKQKKIEAKRSSTTGNKNQTIESEATKLGRQKKIEATSSSKNKSNKDEDDGSQSNDLSPSSKKKQYDKEYAKKNRSTKRDDKDVEFLDMKKSVLIAETAVLDLKSENFRLKLELDAMKNEALKATIVNEMTAPTVMPVGTRQSRRKKCLDAEHIMIPEVQKVTCPKQGIMYKLCLFCLHIYHITSQFVYFF